MDRAKAEFLQKLGRQVVKLRKEKGWSQAELARNCDKDKQSITRLEQGQINASSYYLFQITEGLGIKMKDLMDFKNDVMEEIFNLRYQSGDKSVCFESPERIFHFMVNAEKPNAFHKYKYMHPASDKEALELFSLYMSGDIMSGSAKTPHEIYLSARNRYYIKNAADTTLLILVELA
ncbi:MAG: hypothetical protein JWP12_3072 [Bacteroidetes bacterium]|nr:hypothetical protein [Bacteroidota bacterium]